MQDGVDDLGVLREIHELAHGGLLGAADELKLFDLLLHVEFRAVDAGAGLGRQRAQVGPLLVDLRVVALDGGDLRHGQPRDEADFLDIGDDSAGHAHLIRGVVVARLCDHVGLRAQPLHGHRGQRGSEVTEDLEVRACLPRRVNRRVEGVQVRVHIRRGHVVLLIPGGGWEYDVGDERRGRVAEVRGQHEVELALRRVVDPGDGLRALLRGELGRGGVRVHAQQMAQEEFRALGGRTQQVRAPVEQDARPVFLGRRVVVGELEVAGFQLVDNVVLDVLASGLGLVREEQRVLVELRVGGHPAAVHGLDHGVGGHLVFDGAVAS